MAEESKYKTTLCIGDAHSDPRFDNIRFSALGNFIVDRAPDHIVQLGDWLNLDSINFFHKAKPLLKEGLRLKDDIEAGIDAYELTMEPIRAHNKKLGRSKKKKYEPKLYWFNGNHEERTIRYVQEHPVLEGFIPTEDLVGAEQDGWEVVPYKHYRYIEDVGFTHVPLHAGGSPVSGKYICAKAAELSQHTVVFGHCHRRALHSLARVTRNTAGYRVDSLSAGCFFDYDPEYVRDHRNVVGWWAGLIILHHIAPGEIDIETIAMERVKDEYL
jgi:predicted phosphodiesterase